MPEYAHRLAKLAPALILMICAIVADASPADPLMCSMIGMLARSVVVDRDAGVPYAIEVKHITDAVEQGPNERAALLLSLQLAKTRSCPATRSRRGSGRRSIRIGPPKPGTMNAMPIGRSKNPQTPLLL